MPQADGSWLLVTTLANVGVTLLVKVLLLGWIALTDSAESALGGLWDQAGAVTIGTLGGLAYGWRTSLPLRSILVRRRIWIIATTRSTALSILSTTFLTLTNLLLVLLALALHPWIDTAIATTGLVNNGIVDPLTDIPEAYTPR